MQITEGLIRGFLSGDIKLQDKYYEESKHEDESFLEVFGDTYPSYMIFQRPNEAEKQRQYRKDYFENIGNPVKGFLGLIEKQIDKVFSSEDFRVIFSQKSKMPNKQDTAEWYFTKGYYNGRNLLKSFSESIKSDTLLKPNSVLALLPNDESEGYPTPYYVIVKSENVLYYKANEFCLIKSEMKSDITDSSGNVISNFGNIYHFFDGIYYCTVKETGYDENGYPTYSLNTVNGNFRKHGCDFLPCKKIGRKVIKQTEDGHELRTSDLADSLVFLKEAQMNHEDLAVEHNHHVSSQEWKIGTVQCTTCNGTGKIRGNGKAEVCPTCHGGKVTPIFTGNGLNEMIIPMDLSSLGRSEKLPSQFGGFIERPESGARIFSESFETNIKLALRPFGLENSIITPYNQSGNSKEYDMQEGYAFMTSMADHIEEMLDFLVKGIIYMRYKKLSKDYIEAEIPAVTVPKRFNLSSADSLYNKLKDTSTYSLPDSMKMKYVKQLVEKESGINSDEYLLVKTKEKLDPFPAYTFQQKLLARNALSDLKYILTINIDSILLDCIEENIGFLLFDYKKQKEIAYKKAQEYLDEAQQNLQRDYTVKNNTNIVTETQKV